MSKGHRKQNPLKKARRMTMYISSPQHRKHGKVNLLASKPGSANFIDGQINPFDPDVAIHLAYSRLAQEKGTVQTLMTIAVSFSLAEKIDYGAVLMGAHNVELDYDLSDRLHSLVYVRNVLGARSPKEVDEFFGAEEDTRIIRGLSIQAWLLIERLLSELRRSRIILRAHSPRKPGLRGPQDDDDFIDQAISHMATKVNSVMNQILFWGDNRLYSLVENKK